MAPLEVAELAAFHGKVRAPHGVGFGLEDGSVTAIAGANGAGTTTALRAIRGRVAAGGAVTFAGMTGRPVSRPPPGSSLSRTALTPTIRRGTMTRKTRAWHAFTDRYDPQGDRPNSFNADGWSVCRTMIAAPEQAGDDLSREVTAHPAISSAG